MTRHRRNKRISWLISQVQHQSENTRRKKVIWVKGTEVLCTDETHNGKKNKTTTITDTLTSLCCRHDNALTMSLRVKAATRQQKAVMEKIDHECREGSRQMELRMKSRIRRKFVCLSLNML